MTIEKALEILDAHPEVVKAVFDWFENAWERMTLGQQLDFMLMVFGRISKLDKRSVERDEHQAPSEQVD